MRLKAIIALSLLVIAVAVPLFEFVAFIAVLVLLLDFDKLFATKLTKLYLVRAIVGVLSILFIYFGGASIAQVSENHQESILPMVILLVIGTVLFIALIYVAMVTYNMACQITNIGNQNNSYYFKFSGLFMKIGAFTLPILVGWMICWLADVLFVIGCIVFETTKREPLVEDTKTMGHPEHMEDM